MADKINTEKIEQALEAIAEYMKEAMIVELILQGHKATGDLIQSIEHKIVPMINSIRMTGEFNFYGRFVDTGRRAGGKKVPIDALERWIVQRGFESDAKKVRGMAFAIQKTIFDKGISTGQSWAGESTKDWLTKTLANSEDKINADIEAACDAQMEILIGNMITETITLSKTYGIAA